jgi:dolichol kinase
MKKAISKNELNRKLLHLTSIWVILIYLLLGIGPTFLMIGGATVVLMAMDIVRITRTPLRILVEKLLKRLGLAAMFRANEKNNLNGATYMMLAALITIVWLPKAIFLTAFSILIVSDALAAVVGQLYGRHKFLHKSFEGTAAFLVSSWIICIIFGLAFNIKLLPLIVASIAAAIVELFASKFKMSDNLLIPIIFGIIWNICK